ncbi:PPE domain-containing protein [Mycolicibacterium sp.]|uniref:PPE domain-containing protein n=1 Tax=Mycolicibacterium sp. TaxID=2320850 RepID=UPI003D099B49
MGFTNVAWESRSTEQLARDLAAGPGPMSVGQAGAAWVRVANELTSISLEFDKIVERIKTAFVSEGADAAARKLEDFGRWLQAVSLSAAGNGEQAESAAVANSVAISAMPSIAEAVEARAIHDVMASLAAYNGAILNGRFAELDEAATADRATASAVMYEYEDACKTMAQPWEQAPPPDVCTTTALTAEGQAQSAAGGDGAAAGGAGAGMAAPPPPLAPMAVREVKSTADPQALRTANAGGSAAPGMGGMGPGYAPMAGMARGDNSREHESSGLTETLEGGGEPGAGLLDHGGSWLPATAKSDAPFLVSEVSWGPSSSALDGLAGLEPQEPAYADEPERTLEQVSDRWVSPPVLGVDKRLTL